MSLFDKYLSSVGEVGHVHSVNRVLVYCSGLTGAKIGEKVYFEDDQMGFVFAIGRELTEVLLLDINNVQIGSVVVRTGETLMVEAAQDLLGQVLDPFGIPISSTRETSSLISSSRETSSLIERKGKLKDPKMMYLEQAAPPMIDRVRINENLETGVTVVDVLIPIGKGQRQLVIGDQKSGKTSFLVQTIARQAQLGTVCIYVLIGKKKSDLATTIERLKKFGVMDKTIVLAAPASIPTSMIYLAPFTAFAIAEYFRDRGQDVLIVLDEISRHARYYRELSILARKMPGRDGYPGDIFYLHSHLMERAGRFLSEEVSKGAKVSKVDKFGSAKSKGEDEQTLSLKISGKTASITCLPVVETLNGDFTGYIQTNLMSMTDGHLFFDMNEFQQGFRPAVNISLSVTRTGKQTHKTIERDMSIKIKDVLFAYNQARDVAKFGVELLQATQEKIKQGEKLMAVFDQEGDVIVPKMIQLLYMQLLLSGFWAGTTPTEIKRHKTKILKAYAAGALDELVGQLKDSFELGSLKRFEEVVDKRQEELERIVNSK